MQPAEVKAIVEGGDKWKVLVLLDEYDIYNIYRKGGMGKGISKDYNLSPIEYVLFKRYLLTVH